MLVLYAPGKDATMLVRMTALARSLRHFVLRSLISTPNRVWTCFFVLWLLILSGVFTGFVGGSPGFVQWIRLRGLLDQRQSELQGVETAIVSLEKDSQALENNPAVQEKEVRKVLGYTAKDELIFDFSLSQSAALRREAQPQSP